MNEPRVGSIGNSVSYGGGGEVFRLRQLEKGRETRRDPGWPSRTERLREKLRLLSPGGEHASGKAEPLPPSRGLTLKLLDTTPEEFRRLAREAAGGGRQTTPDEQLEQLRRRFSRALKGTIANFAFEAAEASDAGVAFLWKDGRFDNEFLDELIKALPIDLNLLGAVLEDLHGELLATLRSQRIGGDWGFLHARGADIEVVLSEAPGEVS